MTPILPKFEIFNSFLAFNTVENGNPEDTFANITSHDTLLEILYELACPAEPVNLLTGSFMWEYTDMALYGKDELPFTRYYESSDAAHNHGLGLGWSTDYTAKLTFEDLYAQAIMPKGVTLTFELDFDGSYKNCGDYSLTRNAGGFEVCNNKTFKTWYFASTGELLAITNLDGSTVTCGYSGGRMTSMQVSLLSVITEAAILPL